MKNLYLLILVSMTTGIFAQNITFPNPIFKTYLINGFYCKKQDGTILNIDANSDSEISISEAQQCYQIIMENKAMEDVTGIEYFTNLEVLKLKFNNIPFLDVTSMPNLQYLDV